MRLGLSSPGTVTGEGQKCKLSSEGMKIIIDPRAGFCGGVKRTIEMAEEVLKKQRRLFALGELIHNHSETQRLARMGLQVVDQSVLNQPSRVKETQLLIRAHGEPPETYDKARKQGIELIDGTCPIVIRSQQIAREYYRKGYQIVIVGKKHHPEVIGIAGYCNNEVKVVLTKKDVEQVDTNRKTFVLAQTTISREIFRKLTEAMKKRGVDLIYKDTVCRFISGREQQVQAFASRCDVVLMVGGKHSSNTKVLFQSCQQVNPRSHWIEEPKEIQPSWFKADDLVGITGSASTPHWLMEQTKQYIEENFATQ